MALTLRGVMDRQLTESYDAAVANAQYWQPISDQLSLKWATVARDLRKVRENLFKYNWDCLLYTSPSPRDRTRSRMPSSA